MAEKVSGRRDVDVWWALPARGAERHRRLLDGSERGRLEALRRGGDRDRFVTGCVLLRAAVAARRGVDPADVAIDRTCDRCGRPHGKPRVVGGDGLEVSVAHSGEVVGVAVTQGAAVGLDVEELAGRAGDLPVALALTERETAWHEALPEHERPAAFLAVWTRKEAALKATGDGLRVPLTEFSVTPGGRPPLVVDWPTRPELVRRLRLYDLRARPRYAATLAVLDPRTRVVSELDGRELLARAAGPP